MMRKHPSKHSLIAISLLLALLISGIASAEVQLSDITTFLETDNTNEHEYLPWYTCGHYTRELAYNARDHNISMGAAILSNHPVFRGYHNHIINYIEIDDVLYFIEPQTDNIMLLDEIFIMYQYIRLYPDGSQVPTNWRCNLAPTLRSTEVAHNAL